MSSGAEEEVCVRLWTTVLKYRLALVSKLSRMLSISMGRERRRSCALQLSDLKNSLSKKGISLVEVEEALLQTAVRRFQARSKLVQCVLRFWDLSYCMLSRAEYCLRKN